VNAIVRRLDALEASSRASNNVRNASVSTMSARASDAELLKRMRELVAQSEQNQQGQLAVRIAQVIRDFDAQRVADLSTIQQGLRDVAGRVSVESQTHRDLTNYIVSSSKQK
jgi:DNA-binding protein H-NS